MSEIKNWKWKPNRWWIGLIIFWLFSNIGAGVIAQSGGSYGAENGFIIMTMLIFAVWAAFTDRSWSIPKRIIWVFGVWIVQAILIIPVMLILIILLADYFSVRPDLFERAGNLLAAFPLVVWAMWRSKFFVEPVAKKKVLEEIQEAWKNRGNALDNHGMYEKALTCYDKALEINPKDDEVRVNKGVVLGNLGKHEEALACYDKALEINPTADDIWFNKACSESKLNNKIKAIEYLRRAIELNMKNKENAVEEKDFDNIRNDKRFIELVNSSQNNINNMKIFCQKCGAELKEDPSNFCSYCAFSLQNATIRDEKKGIIGQFFESFKLSLNWSGRFSRRQFAIFYVGFNLINVFIAFLIGLTGFDVWVDSIGWGGIVGLTWVVIFVIFIYSAAIRRFHDLDKSGWYVLLSFIPLVNIIVLIDLLTEKGKEIGETRWG
ncbi:MAG: tetratricopeptide repeat protein [Spirochaetes bacterium]|nr:tetratricopeptide repeat protein [Spirochaetota bacterium]